MAEESTVLEWNSYHSISTNSFAKLYDDTLFTDVTLACEDNAKIKAHKVVLSACSDFFKDILKDNPEPNLVVYLHDTSGEDIKVLKRFMYLGYADVKLSRFKSFQGVAERLLNKQKYENPKTKDFVKVSYVENNENSDAIQDQPKVSPKVEELKPKVKGVETHKEKNSLKSFQGVAERLLNKQNYNNLRQEGLVKISYFDNNKDIDVLQDPPNVFPKVEEFPKLKGVVTHKEKVLVKSRSVFNCNKCDLTFSSRYKRKYHKNTRHINKEEQKLELNIPCSEPSCDKVLKNRVILRNHTRQVHQADNIKRFMCDECTFSFKYKNSLEQHQMKKHRGLKGDISCEQCGYKTFMMNHLRLHMESMHSTSDDYECTKCDIKFKTTRMLKFHDKKIHQGIRYYCELCTYKATIPRNLKIHKMRVHEQVQISCAFCDFKEVEESRMKLHVDRKHK